MKKALVIASFGTSFEETRTKTIDAIVEKFNQEFDRDIYQAWTSHIVKRILKKKGQDMPNPAEILEQLARDGYEDIYIQPTHLIAGSEYRKIAVAKKKYKNIHIMMGEPLLTKNKFNDIIAALEAHYQLKEKEQVLFVGHGSRHPSDSIYQLLNERFIKKGYDNVEIVTIEGEHQFDDALQKFKEKNVKNVTLIPLLFVCGDHTHNDIFGNEDSYYNRLKNEGIHVEKIFKGLGELEEIQKIYTKNAKQRLAKRENKGYEKIPVSIERGSFQIIEDEMGKELVASFTPEELLVIKRVIHATADFEYAEITDFRHDAIAAAKQALKSDARIYVDTNMIRSGINKRILSDLGGRIINYVADESIIEEAKRRETTRSICSIEKAIREDQPNVFVIGNAPTALFALMEQIDKGAITPEFVVAAPIGFVGAAESKEVFSKRSIPSVVVHGRKGGSTVSVSIVNALLYLIKERDEWKNTK